jgi:hypothetical protein
LPETVTRLLADSSGLRLLVSNPRALALSGEQLLTAGCADEPSEPGDNADATPNATGLRWHSRA